ncbi:MAG: energy transducer TonB [Bacteroidales bacterium]|nr:energy transducer TonB [Bacteroidales bacterium]
MKKILFLVCLFLFCTLGKVQITNAEYNTEKSKDSCCSQDYTIDELRAFMFDENRPQFPGGDSALAEYLRENTLYPRAILHFHPTGTVIVGFCVKKDGSISDVRIVDRGNISEHFNKEAIRVVQTMPKWIPATRQGQPICMPMLVRVNFGLDGQRISDE